MPSNAMNISQLIERLYRDMQQHGDLDCVLLVDGKPVAIDGRNVNVAREIGVTTMRYPALVFGMWSDQAGKLTMQPGALYEAAHDEPGEWIHDRSQAPSGQPLCVWKRYGGRDRGFRDGDKWYVFEGGEKPVQIVPEGVLGWRLE